MAAADSFRRPTSRVHELWQTDFTYLKMVGWGWYYLGEEEKRALEELRVMPRTTFR